MSVQDIKKGRIIYSAGCSKESNINIKIDINIVEQPRNKSKFKRQINRLWKDSLGVTA